MPTQSPTMNKLLLQVSCYNLLASAQAKSPTDYWNAECDLKSDIEKLNTQLAC